MQSGSLQQLSFLERSEAHPRAILENDTFGTLNSISLKNFTFSHDDNDKSLQLSLL